MVHKLSQKQKIDFASFVFVNDKQCDTHKIRIRIFWKNSCPFLCPTSIGLRPWLVGDENENAIASFARFFVFVHCLRFESAHFSENVTFLVL